MTALLVKLSLKQTVFYNFLITVLFQQNVRCLDHLLQVIMEAVFAVLMTWRA